MVFALLCEPRLLNATYRELATAARVALGTVGPVIKDLENRKHIIAATAHRRILDPDRLFEEWVAAFPTVLRPKLNARRFRAPIETGFIKLISLRTTAIGEEKLLLNSLLHHLQPQTTTIYTTEMPRQLIIDYRLRADVNGDVEILDVFWNTQRIHGIEDVVPPVLAYANLFTTTERRVIEAARMIYDEVHSPTFEKSSTDKIDAIVLKCHEESTGSHASAARSTF